MRALGSILIAILVGILAIWLLFILLGFALRLVALVIGLGLAVGAYFLAEKLIGRGR